MACTCEVIGLACVVALILSASAKAPYQMRMVFIFFGAGVIVLICVPFMILRPRDYRNAFFPSWCFRQLCRLMGITMEVRGLENVRKDHGAVVIMNHQSAIDLCVLAYLWPVIGRATVVSKKETDSINSLQKEAKAIQERNCKLLLFPEGTRNSKDSLLPFKKGSFHIALQGNSPIQPVVISKYSFVDDEKKTFRPGHALIHILPEGSTTGQEEKEKLYDMSRIRAFGNVPFLIKRTEPQDMTLTYGEAVDKVQILLEFLESNKVPAGAGIALRITDHTPASCLLILAILNHKCHFYPTDKMLLSQALYERMSMAGVEYLLVNKHLAVGHLNFTRLSSILLFNEDCKLYKVKHKPTDPALNVSMADIIYLGTPCTFDPFVVEFFLALQNGATLLTSHHSMKDSPSRVLSALFPDNLVKPGISILQMTPSLFRQFGATSIRERIKCQNDGDSQQGELLLGSATRRCYIPEIDDKLDTQKGDSSICFRATGDLVTRLKDGTILYGERANDVVKRAGNRISLGLITRKIQKCLLSSELATCLWLEDLQKLICCIRTQEPKTRVQQRAQTFDILSKVSIAEQPDRFVYLQHFPCNQILKSYLHDRLECVEDTDEKSVKRQRLEDSNPCGYDLSFRQAGGTSFHAITICREIGLQMCIDDEQRHLFEMLLDENIPLRTLVANNIKLKPVEPAAVTTCHGGLIIKRIEQPVLKLQFHWKVNFEKCVDSPVAEYEGRYVCVGAHSKILRTLDPLTGSELSKVTFLSEQLAMVGCYDGCLYGFNPQTGDIVFNVGIGGMIKSQPLLTADGRRIIVCSYAEDYNVLWCLRIGEKPIFAGPLELPNEQSLIICTLDGSYARVAITDGSVEWTQKLKEPIFSTPVLLESKSNIFLSAEVAGRIHACHLATYSTEGNVFSSLVVKTPPTFMGHSFVVFGCIDQHVYCLRCKTGSGSTVSTIDFELHWKINLGAPIYATPSLLTVQPNGLLVWCGATDGRVVLINFRNGEIQWSDKLPGEVFSSACYIESLRRVYVGCRDNFLYCLGI
ncbi:hypothetical protein M5D96_003407 [Drosophila gunungcola]|uniref:Phospholipid/glycerol acyltransferase domain-containing protein n=1 Tax=Drosophila gunungcola TaxID=103775 RepID=A0A9P9YSI9_9MUSC|nr:hypothetical protein M5D96_003407 [Drosophila gunungcola]